MKPHGGQNAARHLARLGAALSALLCRSRFRTLPGSFAILFFLFVVFDFPRRHGVFSPLAPTHRPDGWTSPIPPQIWQIFLPRERNDNGFVIQPSLLQGTASWLALNPGVGYMLAGSDWARQFVDSHYADDKHLRETYHALRSSGMKSDLLRYLMLYKLGGVYTDLDTVALKPLAEWVPDRLRPRVRFIVGIEYDRVGGPPHPDFLYDVQFCQWTLAAAPGHPIFADMARRAAASIDALAALQNTTLSEFQPSDLDVMNSTGSVAWTRAVFDHIRLADPGITHLTNLSFMTEPRLYGDILLLNIDGFASGRPHSHSTNDSSGLALAKHSFRGSWREVSREVQLLREKCSGDPKNSVVCVHAGGPFLVDRIDISTTRPANPER